MRRQEIDNQELRHALLQPIGVVFPIAKVIKDVDMGNGDEQGHDDDYEKGFKMLIPDYTCFGSLFKQRIERVVIRRKHLLHKKVELFAAFQTNA